MRSLNESSISVDCTNILLVIQMFCSLEQFLKHTYSLCDICEHVYTDFTCELDSSLSCSTIDFIIEKQLHCKIMK